jgi:DNA-binding CsgD family transcriptional regulator
MSGLSATDIRAVLDGARGLLDLDDPADLPAAAVGVATALVPCDHASHNAIDLVAGRASIYSTGPVPDARTAAAFAAHAHENPLVAHQHRTGDAAPARISDFISVRELRRRAIYELFYRDIGVEHQVAFGLRGQAGQVAGVALNRSRGDFSDRDVEVLALLRPLLDQISAVLLAEPVRKAGSLLTPRQRQVLALLSRGATDAQIASELRISERTVGKHLEHIYAALGVANRTAATVRWLSGIRSSPY